MDPLTAVGLAANVIQFISFTRDVILTSNAISKDGGLVENLELEAITRHIAELNSNIHIRPIGKGDDSRGRVDNPQRALTELCEGSKDVAETLQRALQGLNVQHPNSKTWTSIRQALKSVMSAQKIDNLTERLDRYQRGINTALLASLCDEFKSASVVSSQRDYRIDRQIETLLEGNKRWQKDLVDSIQQNNWRPDRERDVQMLGDQLEHGAEMDKEHLYQMRICHRLRFSEIEERHETIAEAYQRSYDWAFYSTRPDAVSQPNVKEPRWVSFSDWLSGEENCYWVMGKPGSGKSTLMKYLYNHRKTSEAIKTWSRDEELITAGFFFWNSGTVMQMSRMGLLQSILFQCVRDRPHLINYAFETRWTNHVLYGNDLHIWTWSELVTALKRLISLDGYRFLFFVDGLDEFDGDSAELSTLIQDLIHISPQTVKFCVASRPWLIFEETFGQGPWLRLENLTRPDIQLYATEKLQSNHQWKALARLGLQDADGMIAEIIDRADGVFLWVVLVVQSLLNGLRDGDTIQDLWGRLRLLPTELEALFTKMLDQLSPEYFVQACELFQVVQVSIDSISLLELSFMQETVKSALQAPVCPLSEDEIRFREETMRRRILSRCRGLLEASSTSKVQYIHRTVRDFFLRDDIWKRIRLGAPDFEPLIPLCVISLFSIKILYIDLEYKIIHIFWKRFEKCTQYARKLSSIDTPLAVEILDAAGLACDDYWGQESTQPGAYLNLFVEFNIRHNLHLVERTVPHWTNIFEIIALSRKVDQDTTATAKWKAARTGTISERWDTSTLPPVRDSNLKSLFDYAFLIGLNFYVCSKLDERLATTHTIAGQGLLAWSVVFEEFNLAKSLLGYYSNSSTVSFYQRRCAWNKLLETSMKDSYKDSKRLEDLYSLVEDFLDHGVDPVLFVEEVTVGKSNDGRNITSVLPLEDSLRAAFARLGQQRIAPAISRVKAANDKNRLVALGKDPTRNSKQRPSISGMRSKIKATMRFRST